MSFRSAPADVLSIRASPFMASNLSRRATAALAASHVGVFYPETTLSEGGDGPSCRQGPSDHRAANATKAMLPEISRPFACRCTVSIRYPPGRSIKWSPSHWFADQNVVASLRTGYHRCNATRAGPQRDAAQPRAYTHRRILYGPRWFAILQHRQSPRQPKENKPNAMGGVAAQYQTAIIHKSCVSACFWIAGAEGRRPSMIAVSEQN